MKKAGIIGMGTISQHYYLGLKTTKNIELVAVCDNNKDFATKALYLEYEYYSNYIDMVKKEKLDYVIISTTPATHFQIAKDCLNLGVNVIIEKPVVLEMNKLNELVNLSKDKGVNFDVMYHWQNGQEVEELLKRYDKSKISSISVSVLDPYSNDGKSINENKVKLEGAWIDSGVNALSYAKCFLDFNEVKVVSVTVRRCEKTSLPLYAKAKLEIDGVNVEILVDWTTGENQKQSEIIYDGRKIFISHSGQTIYDGEIAIKCDDMARLTRHYYNYFVKNMSAKADLMDTIKIHDALFEVRDKYETSIS